MTLPAFYPILDTAALQRIDLDPVEAARGLIDAGARIVQFRHKGEFTDALFQLAERVGRIVQEAGALYIVNDRADIALMLGADGVHVGQDDLPPEAVRRVIGSEMLLGFSTHNEAQLRAAANEPIDYVALGPIFGTVSKDKPDPRVGLDELRRLAPLAQVPLVAIGGIRLEEAADVLQAGATSCAVISDWLRDDWRRRTRRWANPAP